MDAAGTLDEDQSIGDWVPGQIGSKSVGVGEGRVAIGSRLGKVSAHQKYLLDTSPPAAVRRSCGALGAE